MASSKHNYLSQFSTTRAGFLEAGDGFVFAEVPPPQCALRAQYAIVLRSLCFGFRTLNRLNQ